MDEKYICKRCNISFNIKSHLKSHLQRKNICKFIDNDIDVEILLEELYDRKLNEKTFNCEYCDMKFNHSSNKSRHKRICKKRPLDEIEELKQEIDILKNKVIDLQTNNNVIITNNIINNNNNIINNNIILNSFGNETYDHITDEFLKNCITKKIQGIKNVIERIHYSEEVPQNNNIRIKGIKNKLVEVSNGDKWVVKDINESIDIMIKKSCRILNKYYINPESGLLEKDINELDNCIQDFLSSVYDKESKTYFALRRIIMALIIEKSNLN